jgi:hypothetical protein
MKTKGLMQRPVIALVCSPDVQGVETSMRAYSQDVRERVLRAVDMGRERR